MARPHQEIRPSQFVITYGPGSIVETRSGPVVVRSMDRLFRHINRDPQDFEIVDDRLSRAELRGVPGDEALGRDIPWPAVGLYTYFVDRLGVGLKQLMAGTRKWRLDLLSRDDIVSLSERARAVTGIPMLDEVAQQTMQTILDF